MMHELGRVQRGEAHQDVDDAQRRSALRVVLGVALDQVGLAGRGPAKAPWRNRPCMNAPTFSRMLAHSGSSLGSNTTHCVPRRRLSSMYSAVRRTGMYFHWMPARRRPQGPRAPDTGPMTGKLRRQLTPSGLSSPFSVVGHQHRRGRPAGQRGAGPRGRLPDAARAVGAGPDPGHGAAGGVRPREPGQRICGRDGAGSTSRRWRQLSGRAGSVVTDLVMPGSAVGDRRPRQRADRR